jgi:hypothetical protein
MSPLEHLNLVLAICGGVIVVLNFVGVIVVFVANRMAFHKIMTNDLHHVNLSIQDLGKKQDEISAKVTVVAEDLAFLKGGCKLCRPSKRKTSATKTKKVSGK